MDFTSLLHPWILIILYFLIQKLEYFIPILQMMIQVFSLTFTKDYQFNFVFQQKIHNHKISQALTFSFKKFVLNKSFTLIWNSLVTVNKINYFSKLRRKFPLSFMIRLSLSFISLIKLFGLSEEKNWALNFEILSIFLINFK